MSLSWQVDSDHGILRVTVHGAWPSIEEQRQLRQSLIAQGLLTPATRALIDVREMDVATAPFYSGAEQMIAAAMSQGALPLRRAYLAHEGAQFGFVRMLQSLAASTPVQLECFTDEAEAIRWLLDVPDPAGNR